MSDPLRTDPASDAQSGAEREGKIEQLLLLGLDHYFDGQYDQAINVWTRALFLDRGHARARAYIERARTALAEHQRESEELLQRGLAAFDRGASAEARRLIETAITRGAPRDEALSVLDRIHRLDAADRLPSPIESSPFDTQRRSASRRALALSRTLGLAAWIALAVCVVLAALTSTGALSLDWLLTRTAPARAVRPAAAPPLTESGPAIPRRGDRALAQAQAFAQNGRLRDALTRLDEVAITDDARGEADRLRSEIQRQLLLLVPAATGAVRAVAPPPPDGPPR